MIKREYKIVGIFGLSIMIIGFLVATIFGIWGGVQLNK